MKIKQGEQKMGKRIFTLKQLAQRDFHPVSDDPPKVKLQNDLSGQLCLSEMEECFLDLTKNEKSSAPSNLVIPKDIGDEQTSTIRNIDLPIELISRLLLKKISNTAGALGLEQEELQAWLDLQVMAPKQILLTLLRIAREYSLDPLKHEVALAIHDDLNWQAFITVDGYSKILNRHPQFNGITFTESPENIEGIPIWMECAIYRKDRGQPTVIREYFAEVKGDQAIWARMPRRMLRHRVMHQCARLAL